MKTPSLRRRIVGLGVAVVVLVLAAVNISLFLVFRTQLEQQLDSVLDQRAWMVRSEAATTRSPQQLATRLTELGLRATVRAPDGNVHRAEPPSSVFGGQLPPPSRGATARLVSRTVALPDGSTATVFANRAGADEALRNLLVLEAVGLVLATLLATLLLLRTSGLVLRPLREIATSASRTKAGQRGERLRPDQPDTLLGRLASAYDEMLDSLESAVAQANLAQTESEQLYLHLRQTIETANGAFVSMDASGAIVDWNSQAQAIFGWSRREAVKRRLAETIIPPAFREAHDAGLARFLATGTSRILGETVEFEALHRDGHLVPVELSTWVTYDGDEATFNAFLYDITERRKGQEAIARLGAIVESAQEAIFSTSLDGTILTWNRGAEAIYQFTSEEAIGRNVCIIVPADRMDELRTVREQTARGENVTRHETVRRRKDGSEVEVAVTVSPIFDTEGRVIADSTIARDITDQRRMAARLNNTLSALESALDDARRSEERSRRFLADAAHQLRSPIAGIRACAETLLGGTAGDDTHRLLAGLARETARAGRLITSLLRLASLDEGEVHVADRADIASLCASEVERVRVARLGIDLHVLDLPDEQPELPEHAVREIVSNLLDNARRHAASRIDVFVSATDEELHILVSDDGPGVPDGAVERIFERFVSLDGKGGSGLGLPIARALARAHGGDLTYDASGFLVSLPIKRRVPSETVR